eukprot:RCo007866
MRNQVLLRKQSPLAGNIFMVIDSINTWWTSLLLAQPSQAPSPSQNLARQKCISLKNPLLLTGKGHKAQLKKTIAQFHFRINLEASGVHLNERKRAILRIIWIVILRAINFEGTNQTAQGLPTCVPDVAVTPINVSKGLPNVVFCDAFPTWHFVEGSKQSATNK